VIVADAPDLVRARAGRRRDKPGAPESAHDADAFSLPRPVLVPQDEPVLISVDNNRCHIYGICQQEAPEVFRISEGGSLHQPRGVPPEFAAGARQAARCCPMQAIAIEGGRRPGSGSSGPRRRTRPVRGGAAARAGCKRIVAAGAGPADRPNPPALADHEQKEATMSRGRRTRGRRTGRPASGGLRAGMLGSPARPPARPPAPAPAGILVVTAAVMGADGRVLVTATPMPPTKAPAAGARQGHGSPTPHIGHASRPKQSAANQ
jgi:ferredoxin